jgi:hypothetical protein
VPAASGYAEGLGIVAVVLAALLEEMDVGPPVAARSCSGSVTLAWATADDMLIGFADHEAGVMPKAVNLVSITPTMLVYMLLRGVMM